MLSLVKPAFTILCNIISPPFCSFCKRLIPKRSVLCSACLWTVKQIPSCKIPLKRKKELAVYALSRYQDPLKSLILRKNNQNMLASVQLGQLMVEHLLINNPSIDYFVPVPLHWTRYARRGFNQAEIIARELNKKYHANVLSCIKRVKRTPYQSYFIGNKRADNVKDVFMPKREKALLLKGKHIVIVDDLMTTGSTLKEIANMLLDYKPASISAFVVCRTSY